MGQVRTAGEAFILTSRFRESDFLPATVSLNRHRGSGHPLSPATPPYMRVRIRRFSSVELKQIQQSRKTERIEVSNRKCGLQGRAVGQTPGTMRTAGGLSRKGRSDVPLAQLFKPHLATLPLLPDHGSQPAPYPFLQPMQHRGRLAVSEIALPSS